MSIPNPIHKTATQVMQETQEARDKEEWLRQRERDARMQMLKQHAAKLPQKTILPDPARATELNSVTKMQELVPIRVATSRVLEGKWSGRELTTTRIIGSTFGGPHFIMQIGHMLRVGETDTFRVVFVVHMPVKGASLGDAEALADAERTAQTFLHMLNMQRMDAFKQREGASQSLTDEEVREMLAGQRADMLITDDIIQGTPPKR